MAALSIISISGQQLAIGQQERRRVVVSPGSLFAGEGPVPLVVEDDPVVREFAVAACRECGCTVREAGDGEQGLRVFEKHRDIALLPMSVCRVA